MGPSLIDLQLTSLYVGGELKPLSMARLTFGQKKIKNYVYIY
jgi:hypothetical protein